MLILLPDDFSNVNVTILSWVSHPVSSFPTVFHKTDGLLFGNAQNVLHIATRVKQEILTLSISEVEIIAKPGSHL